jgi:hypothetical protein
MSLTDNLLTGPVLAKHFRLSNALGLVANTPA